MKKLSAKRRNLNHGFELVALIASALVFLFTGGSWGFLVSSILLLAYILKPSGAILQTSVARIFLASIIILTSYQLESVLFWLLRITVNPTVYTITTAVIIGLISILSTRIKKTKRMPLTLHQLDIILIIPAFIIGGLYAARVILPGEPNQLSIIRSMTLANDDATHFSIVDALLRNSSNLLISSPKALYSPGLATYPMGWHISTTIAASSFFPDLNNVPVSRIIVVYFILKVFSFFAVILSVTLFFYQLSASLKHKLNSLSTNTLLYFGIALSTFIVVVPQMFEGFFSFLPILLYTSLFATLLLSAPSPQDQRPYLDLTLTTIIIGSTLSWMLTGPVLAVSYFLIKLYRFGSIKKLTAKTYFYLGLVVGVFLFQLWNITHASKSAVNVLAAQGGISTPDFIFITILTGIFFFLLTQRKFHTITRGLLFILLPLYALLAAVMLYVSSSSPLLSYYYSKIEIVLLSILLPIGVIALIEFSQKISFFSQSRTTNQLLRIAFVVFIPIALIPAVVGYPYFHNNVSRALNYALSREDAIVINDALNHKFEQDSTLSFFFLQKFPGRSIVGSHIVNMDQKDNRCNSMIFSSISSGDITKLGDNVSHCPYTQKIVFHTNPDGEAALSAAIPERLIKTNQVTIKTDV